jgi:PAS domain S-box-containing protein
MPTLSAEVLEGESEALRVILETISEGVFFVNGDAKLLFHNQAAQEILGAADAARGGPVEWTNLFGWYLADQATQLAPEELPLARILRGEDVRDELLFVRNGQRPSGVWIRVTGKAMRDAAGGISAGVIFFRDVTEKRLSQQTKVLAQVGQQIADGVFLTDRQGFIEYVNPAFEAMTGFSADEVRGRTPRILKSGLEYPAFYQRLWDELLAGHAFQTTIANRKKTGEIYQVEETVTPITDESGRVAHFVAVIRDITEALNQQEREVQLRLARQVQQKFYRAAPTVPGFDVAAAAYPAYETSGDYFDFIPLPHNRLCVAVGDVEGHGFGSALVMALTRAYVHSFAAMGLEVDQILSQVNRMLVDDLGDRCFVTLMLVSLDLGARTLVYAGAGHIPGYVLNPSGSTAHTLESSGPPLGLFSNVRYSRNPSITLMPGQLLVLLTDGITESTSPGGMEWGAQGALNYLVTHNRQTAGQLAEGLYREALRFTHNEPQKDDITSVIVKVEPTSGISGEEFESFDLSNPQETTSNEFRVRPSESSNLAIGVGTRPAI